MATTEGVDLEILPTQPTEIVPQTSEEIQETESTYAGTSTVNNDDIDKKKLWQILQDTQCPLMPSRLDINGGLQTAYYFNNEFWVADEPNSCRPVVFRDKDKENTLKRGAMDDSELMFAVDEYISDVRVNKSFEIEHKLKNALAESKGIDDGDSSNDAYQKLIPTMIGRLTFLSIFFTYVCMLVNLQLCDKINILSTFLNGYFLAIGLYAALEDQYNTPFMNNTALVMSICELILYADLLFGKIFWSVLHLIIALYRHDTTCVHSKIIAIQLKSLSTLSMLRYMPSIEIVSSFIVHWKESLSKIWAGFYLLFQNQSSNSLVKNRNCCEVIFAIPCYIIEVMAPFLSLYALLVKIKQLEFVSQGEPFADWSLAQYLAFAAFLNQVAGLRILRNVETESIQHFVFSGPDASLDTDELILLNKWWDVTLLSAVSTLHLGWYDNMVFWYSLDPQKIQLLLKFHDVSKQDGDSLLERVTNDDTILSSYDEKVFRLLDEIKSD